MHALYLIPGKRSPDLIPSLIPRCQLTFNPVLTSSRLEIVLHYAQPRRPTLRTRAVNTLLLHGTECGIGKKRTLGVETLHTSEDDYFCLHPESPQEREVVDGYWRQYAFMRNGAHRPCHPISRLEFLSTRLKA